MEQLLRAVGWTADDDLRGKRLLEPAAGDGRFVAAAAVALVRSLAARGIAIGPAQEDAIRAFEIYAPAARVARHEVAAVLVDQGLGPALAVRLAKAWIRTADFLLDPPEGPYTHVVGNPPYVRWSRIPAGLRRRYEAAVEPAMVGGDLFLPFLDRSLDELGSGGAFGFVCSDRWRFMAFAEGFRRKWLSRIVIASEEPIAAAVAFERRAGTYASVLAGHLRDGPPAPAVHSEAPRTLANAGYRVRVGPALGCTVAFVQAPNEDEIEPTLLMPWIRPSDIREGRIAWSGYRVATMNRDDGTLIDPAVYPQLAARLRRHRRALAARSIVRNGASWFRPIDRVRAVDWQRPKLLVPELAKTPRVALDGTGAIPAHGVYAIFAPDDDLAALAAMLADGGLARLLDGKAPKISNGYVRCYGRFLSALPAP